MQIRLFQNIIIVIILDRYVIIVTLHEIYTNTIHIIGQLLFKIFYLKFNINHYILR